jgi:hypothetical protein
VKIFERSTVRIKERRFTNRRFFLSAIANRQSLMIPQKRDFLPARKCAIFLNRIRDGRGERFQKG